MFLKKIVLLLSSRRGFHKSFLRALPSTGIDNRSSIKKGVLYSDSNDIVIPSANISDIIYDRIKSFHQYKAIVSITQIFITFQDLRMIYFIIRRSSKTVFHKDCIRNINDCANFHKEIFGKHCNCIKYAS